MDERVQKYDSKMTKTLNGFEAELSTIRAGRANPHILDKITVITEAPHRYSRWQMLLCLRHV